uniref:Ras family protein n=1 Tax=Macrostomum lignano TaxID=282301 RepID=A0A1I8F2I4_9PLAT
KNVDGQQQQQQQQKKQQLTRQEKDLCNKKTTRIEPHHQEAGGVRRIEDKNYFSRVTHQLAKPALSINLWTTKADIRTTQVTMLCDFYHCLVPLSGRAVHIRIWDTGGMERFHDSNLTASFYRNSDGVLLVFSVNDLDSFNSLPRWLERVRQNVGQSSQFDCGIIGNKSICPNSANTRSATPTSWDFTYTETSALDVVNVQKAFTDLALAVIRRNQTAQQMAGASQQQLEKPLRLFRRADSADPANRALRLRLSRGR